MSQPLDTGLDTLNDDHSHLFRILYEVRKSLQDGERFIDAASALMVAREYCGLHIEKEEFLMRESGYPKADLATRAHYVLLGEFSDLVTFVEKSTSRPECDRAILRLTKHIINHIRYFDRDYALFIKERFEVPHIELKWFRGIDSLMIAR